MPNHGFLAAHFRAVGSGASAGGGAGTAAVAAVDGGGNTAAVAAVAFEG